MKKEESLNWVEELAKAHDLKIKGVHRVEDGRILIEFRRKKDAAKFEYLGYARDLVMEEGMAWEDALKVAKSKFNVA